MDEEEYDRWLAESLDLALTLLRGKTAEASRERAFATERTRGTDGRCPDVNWVEDDGDTRAPSHPEDLSLKLIGLFTLLATHAGLNAGRAQTSLCERRGPRNFEAINHLALAIEETKLGHVEAAKTHAREALRRLNLNKPLP
jgi:hypothetical protein